MHTFERQEGFMKIVTYVLGALLAAAVAAAALFYFSTFQPMAIDYARMKAGMPELDRAKTELKKYKEKEARETKEAAWITPIMDDLTKGLSEEILAGTVEVAATGNGIVVNIAENTLYTPHSITFAQDSPPFRAKLAGLLGNKNLNGKEIIIANSTDSVPAQGKGRKKIPARDAASLATERSLQLVKFLSQSNVDREALIAAGYGAKMRDSGFKIKDHKTMIVIQNPPSPSAQKPAMKPAEKTDAESAANQTAQPKAIPLKPAEPNTN
jgi:hypothetical protein